MRFDQCLQQSRQTFPSPRKFPSIPFLLIPIHLGQPLFWFGLSRLYLFLNFYAEWRMDWICVCVWFLLACGSWDSFMLSVQSLSHVRMSATPWTAACQTSLPMTNSRSLLKLMSIESVMPSNHLILCRPLPLLPSIFPSIRVFSSESVLHIRWPKDWSFSFSLSASNEYSGLISFRIDSSTLAWKIPWMEELG